MLRLTPLDRIVVPPPAPDELYSKNACGREFSFRGLKALLGASDVSKAGDRNAGLAAPDDVTREVARSILSSLTLKHLYERPLTDEQGKVDSVMRVNYDIDRELFRTLEEWSLGDLKDHLLRCPGPEAAKIGHALTGVMAAALAKLMGTHDLIYAARKINRPTKARTTLGLPGTLSSRLQPNHPVDDLRGMTLLVYAGLSMGSGDALFGLNPAVDTVENISALLRHLDKLRRKTGAPTQICVLAHVKTQLACLEKGVPVEILFQSLAGTESTNLTEFDITVDLLDRAYRTMKEKGPLGEQAPQFMYFETGQGSEYSYGKHNGIDMATTEALTYGLARRWDPFMVNNVTGFIGPETHLDNLEMITSNLQDHFMGKLLGLPMGMAPCYTLHSRITLDGQQMATELLAAAGANFYMDVCLNVDRMLAYFDTSAHDNQTLREIFGRTTTPEYLEWALTKGIFQRNEAGGVDRGPRWGDPRIFCESDVEFQELLQATPSVYGFKHAGPRPADPVTREFKTNESIGREAIHSELRPEELSRIAPFRILRTRAADKDGHLNSPGLGSRLSEESARSLSPEGKDVQVVVSDGLSAEAIHHNLPELLPVLMDGLGSKGWKVAQPILARYGRVKLAEHVLDRLQAKVAVMLIGERPGGDALASRSMSAYLVYALGDPAVQRQAAAFSQNPDVRYEYTVITNIYSSGLPSVEAGSVIAERVNQILTHRAAGNRLEAALKGGP